MRQIMSVLVYLTLLAISPSRRVSPIRFVAAEGGFLPLPLTLDAMASEWMCVVFGEVSQL